MPYTPGKSRVVIQTPHPDGSRTEAGSDFRWKKSFHLLLLNKCMYKQTKPVKNAIPKRKMLCNLRCLKVRLRLLCNKLSTAQQPEPRLNSVIYVTFVFSEWCIIQGIFRTIFFSFTKAK